jgi:hypothetical protein
MSLLETATSGVVFREQSIIHRQSEMGQGLSYKPARALIGIPNPRNARLYGTLTTVGLMGLIYGSPRRAERLRCKRAARTILGTSQ